MTPLRLRAVATDADEAIFHRAAVGHCEDRSPVTEWAVAYGTAPSGSHFAMSARELMEFVRLHLDDPKLAVLREPQVDAVPDAGVAVAVLTNSVLGEPLAHRVFTEVLPRTTG